MKKKNIVLAVILILISITLLSYIAFTLDNYYPNNDVLPIVFTAIPLIICVILGTRLRKIIESHPDDKDEILKNVKIIIFTTIFVLLFFIIVSLII